MTRLEMSKKTEKEIINIVKETVCALKYVQNQTEEMCLEAVKQYGSALAYVHNQTEEICLEAVKRNGSALVHVRNQTEEICLEAVKRNGDALAYVNVEFLREDLEEIDFDNPLSNFKTYKKEMTIKEVEELLCFEIKIIKENNGKN